MKETEKVNHCRVCGITSHERVLLVAEVHGEETHVCVRCLPQLIHGSE